MIARLQFRFGFQFWFLMWNRKIFFEWNRKKFREIEYVLNLRVKLLILEVHLNAFWTKMDKFNAEIVLQVILEGFVMRKK